MPRKKRALADKARRQTAAGQKRVAAEQAAAREKELQEDKKLQQEMRQRAERLFAEFQKKVSTAAREGRTQTRVTVMQWEREPHPRWCSYLVRYTRELLEGEGFQVKVEEEEDKPIGSDPLFPYTTYNVYLLLSWDKPKNTKR